jgi:hypothetical protein
MPSSIEPHNQKNDNKDNQIKIRKRGDCQRTICTDEKRSQ